MRILVVIGIIFACLAFAIGGIGLFLSPDDLEDCSGEPSTGSCEAADAIIAVSGGDTEARADEAIRLYQQGWAPLLIFSGAAQDASGPSNALIMKRAALEQGVAEESILIEEFSNNTEENAANTSSFIKTRNIARVILVTSAYHQRRTSLEFEARLSSDGVEIVNHPVASDDDWDNWWWTTTRGWWLAGGELVKILIFYINRGQVA